MYLDEEKWSLDKGYKDMFCNACICPICKLYDSLSEELPVKEKFWITLSKSFLFVINFPECFVFIAVHLTLNIKYFLRLEKSTISL